MTDPLAERVVAIIAAQAARPAEAIAPDMTLEALGLDSLGLVELVFALEEAFDIHLPFAVQGQGASVASARASVASVITAVREGAAAGVS